MTGLQKQVIPVEFDQGMDTKTDPKKLMPGSLLLLENAVKKKRNRLEKRPGNAKIPNVDITGAAIENPESLAVFNDELLQYADQRLYSYSAGASKWIDKGAVVSAIVKTGSIVKNTASQSQVDSATNRGVTVYAWEDSRGGVRASVYDADSGTALLADVSLVLAGFAVWLSTLISSSFITSQEAFMLGGLTLLVLQLLIPPF